jgi:polar amino acid transport system substrate-binding protein
MMKRSVLVLVAVTVLSLGGCGDNPPQPDGKEALPVLRVGLEPEFAPMEYRTPSGAIEGFDVDLIHALAEEMGYQVTLVPTAWDGIIAALQTGKIDLICSGMTITDKRKEAIDFSDPYFTTGLCLLVSLEKGEGVNGWQDLNRAGVVLAVKRGTTGEQTAEKLMPKATRKVYDSENDCALEVASGRATAFVYDQMSILKHARKHARKTRAMLKPFNEESYGIALRKGEGELLAKLNRALAALRSDGRYQTIYDRHIRVNLPGDQP